LEQCHDLRGAGVPGVGGAELVPREGEIGGLERRDGAQEVVVVELELPERGERGEARRQEAEELVVVKPDGVEVLAAGDGVGDGPGEVVAVEPELLESRHGDDDVECAGELGLPLLVVKPEPLDGGAVERGGDGAGEVVVGEREVLQPHEAAEEGRDPAGEAAVVEGQHLQLRRGVGESRRERPAAAGLVEAVVVAERDLE